MTDQRLEIMVGRLLRGGVLASALIVLAGGIWFLAEAAGSMPSYYHFHGVPDELSHVGAVLASLARPRAEAVIQLGLLLLIATPVARVALALVGFALERDFVYVIITLVVLAVLVYSMVLPFGSGGGPHATGFRSTPMPSTSTSTTSPGAILRVVPGVPVKMRSPGMRVT
jgi:uncharacterized membrane protein